jgi:hypothetical protein
MLSKKKEREELTSTEISQIKDSKKTKRDKNSIKNYSVSIVIPSSIVDNAQVINKKLK